MSRRPRRKAAQSTPYAPPPSNAYYVGYVEEHETVEMIMKKFEALEQLEQEKRQRQLEEQQEQQVEAQYIKGKEKAKEEDDEPVELALTEEELNELFKQTSTFTLQSALAKREQSLYGDDEESYLEFLDLEGEDGDDYYDEANFWDDEDPGFGDPTSRKRARGGGGARKAKAAGTARQPRAPFESCEITGEDGFVYTIRKKVRYEDPNAPTYVRIPPQPIPRSWCKTIAPFAAPKNDLLDNPTGSSCVEGDILKMNLANYGEFEAILMDPPWHTGAVKDDPNRLSGTVTPEELAKLHITDALLPKGLAFVWIEKELIPRVFKLMKKWNFIYVENFAWVKKSVNNTFYSQPYKYFQKSKSTLFIFRKFAADGKDQLELRHQRNPDVVFDFVKKKQGGLPEEKPDFTYTIIETLLPNAVYNEQTGRGKLLELWGRKNQPPRRGWTTVVQRT